MHSAARESSMDVAELLIRSGAEVNAESRVSTTRIPMHDTSPLYYDNYTLLHLFKRAYDYI